MSAKDKELAGAATKGKHEDVARLIAEGASSDALTSRGWPALVDAAMYGHLKVLEILHGAGANLEAQATNRYGTALMIAALNGHHDCADALLRWGADVDAVDKDGNTALHEAADNGRLECARLLVRAGADRAKRNDKGQTALEVAQEPAEQKEYESAERFAARQQDKPEIAALLRDPRESGLADEAMPAGTRVRVAKHGDGVYERFERSTFGANDHFIRFPSGLQKVELRKLKPHQWSVLPAPAPAPASPPVVPAESAPIPEGVPMEPEPQPAEDPLAAVVAMGFGEAAAAAALAACGGDSQAAVARLVEEAEAQKQAEIAAAKAKAEAEAKKKAELAAKKKAEAEAKKKAEAEAKKKAEAEAKKQAEIAAALAVEPEPEPAGGLTLDAWLVQIKLQRYASAIKEAGYDELDFLKDASEADVKEMTVDIKMKKPHANSFLSKWKELISGAGPPPPAAGSPTAAGSPASGGGTAGGGAASDAAKFGMRCVDFDESGSDLLGPIRGIFDDKHNPRLSVEEAAKSLPFDIAGEVWTMKKFLKTKKTREAIAACPGLTTDGAGAIYLFTCESPLYKELNAKLRARDRAALKEGYFPYARLLFEGYRALCTGKPRMLNRGVKKDLVGASPDAYAEDESLLWWSFSSTTKKIKALENPMFLGATGDRTIFQIMTRHGADIGSFSAIPSEAEVLLPAGIALKVTSVLPKSADGLTIVTLEDDDEAPELVI